MSLVFHRPFTWRSVVGRNSKDVLFSFYIENGFNFTFKHIFVSWTITPSVFPLLVFHYLHRCESVWPTGLLPPCSHAWKQEGTQAGTHAPGLNLPFTSHSQHTCPPLNALTPSIKCPSLPNAELWLVEAKLVLVFHDSLFSLLLWLYRHLAFTSFRGVMSSHLLGPNVTRLCCGGFF